MQPERIIRGQQVVTTQGTGAYALWIEKGKIVKITTASGVPTDIPIEETGNWVVMPALVDSHVHINEPGRTEWEGFETATRAAAAGGITTIVDMPLNSIPVTTSVKALETKLASTQGKLWIDCGFYGGVIPGNTHELKELAKAGVRGFKCFLIHSGIDDFPNVTEADLHQSMPVLTELDLPLLVHAELDHGQAQAASVQNPAEYQTYLDSRPRQWELDAIDLMIRLCRQHKTRVHIVHLSCADALPMLADAKAEGLPITVETCSHYLSLHAETIPDGCTEFKCAPPIREQENADRLWQGLADGTIDFIVSDHSPCTPELKLLDQGDFMQAWGGVASLQLGLSIIWSEAQKRGFTLEQLTQWLCTRPAKFVGLGQQKGRLAVGYDADWILWDPETQIVIEPAMLHHRHKITPYRGKVLKGGLKQTWLRGQRIFDDGLFTGPLGQPLLTQTPVTTPG